MSPEIEPITRAGMLVVITGISGAGKDTMMDLALRSDALAALNLTQVVTCATRTPRPGEINGTHYHFISADELHQMHTNGELVEPPTQTGTSFKATSKRELARVVEQGVNLV